MRFVPQRILHGLRGLSFGAAADELVRGHTRSDGTYVAPIIAVVPTRTGITTIQARGITIAIWENVAISTTSSATRQPITTGDASPTDRLADNREVF